MNWKEVVKNILSTGISQKKLAQELNVTQGYISHLLTGRRKKPSYEIGERIKKFYFDVQKSKTPSGN